MLAFTSFLLLLCVISVMLPSTSVSVVRRQTLHQAESQIVFGNPRQEYYILNVEFFEFLARTSMECLIQVEPAEEWDGEATVKTTMLDSSPELVGTAESANDEPDDKRRQGSRIVAAKNGLGALPPKYVLAYRHFEQLGKTMDNLIQLAAVAKHWQRYVVKPNIQQSRLSLEKGFGAYPLETYFNVRKMNELLYENGYAKLIPLESFLRDCNYMSKRVRTTVVHFVYAGYYKGNTKRWYNLGEREFRDILNRIGLTGWTDCPFINKHLNLTRSLRGLAIGRQVCVNPEVIVSESVFQEEILGDDKCVVFVQWRGFGSGRAHFTPDFKPFLPPKKLKHNIPSSDLVAREVSDFTNSKLPARYIAVHLRTERLLGSFKKLRLCIDHVIYLVGLLRELRGVRAVFLATDMTRYGSDAFDQRRLKTTNASGSYFVRRADIAQFHKDAARRLNAVTYKPSVKPFVNDKGLVSLVEMNILKGGLDLVTIGSGSFRAWIVSFFRQHQSFHKRRGYTILEICSDGNIS